MASRRASEELILHGKVRVNGAVVREMGTRVAPGDRIDVEGRTVRAAEDRAYVVLHKPVGVVTTMRDPEGRRTVADLLSKSLPRVVPVGRLDYDTSGLLLLTNDGELAHVMTHPRFGVEKVYRARVRGRLAAQEAAALFAGVELEEFRAAGVRLRVIAARSDATVLDVSLHEGKNRQVRRMLEAVGHPVLELCRLRFGPLSLGDLPPGEMRGANPKEIAQLRRLLP